MKPLLRKFCVITPLLLWFFLPGRSIAQNPVRDSLWGVFQDESKHDTVRMRALRNMAFPVMYEDADSALVLYEKLYNFAAKDSNLRFIGYSFHDRAVLFSQQDQYGLAVEYNFTAMKYWTREKFANGIASCHVNLGNVYTRLKEYDKALDHYTQAISFFSQLKDQLPLSGIYNDIGNMLRVKGDSDSLALVYLFKGLAIRQEIGYRQGIAWASNNIAGVYYNMHMFDTALKYLKVYQDYGYESGRKSDIVQSLYNIGETYNMKGEYSRGRDSCFKAYRLSIEYDMYHETKVACECLYVSYEGLNQIDSAHLYYKRYVQAKDSLAYLSRQDEVASMEVAFRYEQKAIEDSLVRVEEMRIDAERAQGEKNLRYTLFAGLGLTLVFAGVMFNRFRVTRKQKNLIAEQNIRTEQQKKVIEEKNKEITDSINYAQRIQQAVLPPEAELKKAFRDIFVLFRPRDIVSGDFYWYDESKTNKVIALADCTGHGVPGGFMSMLGYEILQDVVMLEEITTTSEALRRLDQKVTLTLNKNDKAYRDGMDMALCAFPHNKMELLYSGANRPLYHFSNGIMHVVKPDKHTIGGAIDDVRKEFTMHTRPLAKGDMIYIFSDGYADQFGGPEGKKFMSKKLEQLLTTIATLECHEQKAKLEAAFNAWKGRLEQVDDVCIVGIRI